VKIDIQELLGSVRALQSPNTRIGYPDDPTPVELADPKRLSAALDDALKAFLTLRSGGHLTVCSEINTYHRTVSTRFVQDGPSHDRKGQVEPTLTSPLRALRVVVAKSRGELHYWGGNNYFDLSLPYRGPMRETFPEVQHLPWDERYRSLLEQASWESLRWKVFRFSSFAETFALRCAELGLSRVLIPSVGLCVHPWLFAAQGLSVVATDLATSALTVLSAPEQWPRLYSLAAYERWDIGKSASYATQGNPEKFERMPDLEDQSIRESLGHRITFARCDWAELPLETQSIDAIFATNALPRESDEEQWRVLQEWARVVRPGGLVFIAQHNFFHTDLEPFFTNKAWAKANILGKERLNQADATRFQIWYTSG
jgi:SAM-dependent methyltransferase